MGELTTWVFTALMLACAAVLTLWTVGATYFDVCRETKCGLLLAPCWAIGVVLLVAVWQPLWQPFIVLIFIATLFLGWWLRQKPSDKRNWDASVAVLPRAVRQGDAFRIENTCNFEYRSLDDFTPHYETRRKPAHFTVG
jgi:hypothetical protein